MWREPISIRKYLKKYLAEYSISLPALSQLSEFEPKFSEELRVASIVSHLKKINESDDNAEIAIKKLHNKEVIKKKRNAALRSTTKQSKDTREKHDYLRVNTLRGLFNSEQKFRPNAQNSKLMCWMFESEIVEYNNDLLSTLKFSEQQAEGGDDSDCTIVECEVITCKNTLTVSVCPSLHFQKCFEKFVVVNKPNINDCITICRSCLSESRPVFDDDYTSLVKKIEAFLENNVPGVDHNFVLSYLETSKSTLYRLRHAKSGYYTYINKKLAIKMHRFLLSADIALERFHFLSLYHDFLYGKATKETKYKLLNGFFDIGHLSPRIKNSFKSGQFYSPHMKVTDFLHRALVNASTEMLGKLKWSSKYARGTEASYELHPDIIDYDFGGVACMIDVDSRLSMSARIIIDLNVVLTEQIADENDNIIGYKYIDNEQLRVLVENTVNFDVDETQGSSQNLSILKKISGAQLSALLSAKNI